jgi:hypothetical protein
LDHLVSGRQQRFRDGEAERLGGFEVDDEFEFRRLLDWEVGWFIAFENATGIEASVRRRAFIAGLGSAAAWPVVAWAQQAVGTPPSRLVSFPTSTIREATSPGSRP